MSAAVHVCEHQPAEPDLFGDTAPPAPATKPAASPCTLMLSGRLAGRPHVAMKAADAGHFIPVIELDLDDVGAGHHRVRAWVPFPPDQRDQAERQARALHRGQLVTVATSLADVRVLLPAASLVTTTSTTPTP
jgi:hypothetical protein